MSKLFELLQQTARAEGKLTIDVYPASGNIYIFADNKRTIDAANEEELIAKLSDRLANKTVAIGS